MNEYWDGYESTSGSGANRLKLGTNRLNLGTKKMGTKRLDTEKNNLEENQQAYPQLKIWLAF